MKRSELNRTFMMMSNWRKLLVSMVCTQTFQRSLYPVYCDSGCIDVEEIYSDDSEGFMIRWECPTEYWVR